MSNILGVEAVNKLEGMDLSILAKYVQERSIKSPKIVQPNQPCQRELIDSPTTPGSRKRSRKKAISISFRIVEQGALETSNVPATLGTQTSSTMTCFESYIGTYDTKVEYDVVSGEIRMTDVGKVFVSRLKVSCLQQFKEHLHLPFSKIPMHLQKAIIHDMETEFSTGWSAKKIKKQMSQNCKRFQCNQTKNIKKYLLQLRNKRRPLDVSVKVWKEIIKAYDKADDRGSPTRRAHRYFNFLLRLFQNH